MQGVWYYGYHWEIVLYQDEDGIWKFAFSEETEIGLKIVEMVPPPKSPVDFGDGRKMRGSCVLGGGKL